MSETSRPEHGYWLVGRNRVKIQIGSEETDGRLCVVEAWGHPGDGAPLHRHVDTETFVVTAGRLRLWVEGEMTELGPEQSVTVPSGAAHTYVVLEPTEWLLVLSNTQFDRFVADVGRPVTDLAGPTEPDPEPPVLAAAAAAWNVEILGPPPPELRA
jgi:quercetin dioxygenase-like cupin family protein